MTMPINLFANLMRPYFDFLSRDFEHFANEAVLNNVKPDDIARDFLSDARLRASFNKYMMPEIESKISGFWSQTNVAILSELSKLPGLKARFGGDIGPQHSERIFERLGVYYDSLVVPDPVLRALTMPGPHKWKDYYVLKYCIAQVLYRDVYLADVYPPIAVMFGEEHLLKETSHYPRLKDQSLIDAIAVANAIFDQSFNTEEEAKQFFRKVGTSQALAREVADVEMFRFDEDAGTDPLHQIEALEKDLRINLREDELPEDWKGALGVWVHLNGRMIQANELLEASNELDAHPVIQAPISFHWLATKVRINSELIGNALGEGLLPHLPLTNALLSQQLEWISNVPLDGLIRLRRQGFLSELRETIAGNFSELSTTPLDRLERTISQVDSNLQGALNRHQEQLQVLNQTLLRELAISVPTLLLSIAGAMQPLLGTMLPPWLPVAATVGGAVSLKDVISRTASHISKRRRLGKSPIGILWHARGPN
jgi:hypothetical protein